MVRAGYKKKCQLNDIENMELAEIASNAVCKTGSNSRIV